VTDWIKIPAEPINKGSLKLLSANAIGQSIAALKTYTALLGTTDNERTSVTYCTSKVTLGDLETITGLSRSMVVSGINRLIELGLISAERQRGKTNTYTITLYDTTPWGKIPFYNFLHERGPRLLCDFRPRGKLYLNALKIYLFLSVSVDRRTQLACRTYDKIEEKTGVRRNDIHRALSILIEFKMIKLRIVANQTEEHLPNSYEICGINNLAKTGGPILGIQKQIEPSN
jgi:DNA-binding transcriptional ArsR family regulator